MSVMFCRQKYGVFLYSEAKFACLFKGLRAEFPQFLVKVRRDIVAEIESMSGQGVS